MDGTLSLEIQDYVAIPFVNLVGVTFVRITTDEDWQAFFDDADEAFRSGHFVQQLIEVNAVLAERLLLSGAAKDNLVLTRLHITWDGSVRTGPYGTKIGKVGDSLPDIRVRALSLRPESAVAAVYYPDDIQESLEAKPWIRATLPLWMLGSSSPVKTGLPQAWSDSASVFTAPHSGMRPPSASAPFVLKRAAEHTLLDTKTGRLFTIGTDAAAIIEAVSNVRDIKVAARVVAPALKVSAGVAEGAARAVVTHFDQLGIDIIGAR